MHKGINIIFLDVDGVLNCASTKERCGQYIGIEEEKVRLLKQLVDKTKAYLILTSTWKFMWYRSPEQKCKQDELADYLDESLDKYGLKITEKTRDKDPFNRGRGIIDYLTMIRRRGVKVNNFVILDDMTFDYVLTNLKNHFVKTNYETGLQQKHIDLALFMMNAIHEENQKV